MPRRGKLSSIVSVGGIGIALEGKGTGAVPPGLHPFLADGGKPLAVCRGGYGRIAIQRAGPALFDSDGCWRVDGIDSGIRLLLRKGPAPGEPYHQLDLCPDLTEGRVLLDPSDLEDGPAPFLLRDPLHELWTCFLLMRGRGLLVHGLGVLVRGEVHAFLGESGAGKSTLAGLFERAGVGTILSDDRLVIRPADKGFLAFGTPWHGEGRFASAQQGPLRTISFLHKAETSAQHALPVREAVRRLFGNCFLAGWPRSGIDFVLGTCVELATRLPCRELRFRKDETALSAAGLI